MKENGLKLSDSAMGPPSELIADLKSEMDLYTGETKETVREAIQEKPMQCASNFEDDSFDMVESNNNHENVPCEKEDLQLDIVEYTNTCDHGLEEITVFNDATEYSSSFGDTASGTENGSGLSDNEVESAIYDSSSFNGFDGFTRMRKRRLTDHWRRFIRPTMWRCKWIELQIRELQSQAQKYDKELEECYLSKQCELEKLKIEESNAKSVPLSSQFERKKVVKRKKRKRVEATTDPASYMSNHTLFSYYDHRKSGAEGGLLNDNFRSIDQKNKNSKDEIDLSDGSISLDFNDSDRYLEEILWKIETAKSEARMLKSRVDKVLNDNPGKFSSVNRLSWLGPGDSVTRSDPNAACSDENVDVKPVISVCTLSHHTPDNDTKDLLIPEIAGSSHGEESNLPNKMIKTMEGASVEDSLKKAKHKSPKNQAGKDEFQKFERVINQLTKRPQVSMDKPNKSLQISRSKIPKRKRKRGKRRPGFSGLRRRTGI